MKTELDEEEIITFIIKEDSPCKQLFQTYSIEEVPTVILLNVNLSVMQKITNISPNEIFKEFSKNQKILESNQSLEEEKYQENFTKQFLTNTLIILEFSKEYNHQFEDVKKFLQEKELSYLILTKQTFNEMNGLTILAQIRKHFKQDLNESLTHFPIAYFNKKFIFSENEIKDLYEIHHDLFETLNQNLKNKFQLFLQNNPILLFINKATDNQNEQEEIQKQMEKAKIIFSYLDLSEKQNIQTWLKDLIQNDFLQYPILKNHEQKFFDKENLKDDFLHKFISKEYFAENVDDLIKYLINSQKIFVFIKGTPEFPLCKFSRQMVNYLNSKPIKFGSFNILTNSELRERLKDFSNWKTYPQLYVDGKLIGGNDTVEQMEELGQTEELFGIIQENKQFKINQQNYKQIQRI